MFVALELLVNEAVACVTYYAMIMTCGHFGIADP